MKLGKHQIKRGSKPFIIAEIAQSHEGSLGQALAFVDIAADCGADAIKFQTHIAEEESTPNEPWRIKFSQQDATRYDYWKRISFPKDYWQNIKEYADKKGLVFLSSPFSRLAVSWLDQINMDAWKIASGEVHNEDLLLAIEKTKKPVIISTGLSDFKKCESLVKRFHSKDIEVCVLHCTTMYPTPAEEIGMNIFEMMRDKLPSSVPIGLSDHSGEQTPSIIASYLGASVIEVHLSMHKKMFGPDVSSSLDPHDFSGLVKGVNFASLMSKENVKKSKQLEELDNLKSIFSRSLVFNRDLKKGHKIKEDDIGYKKPAGGLTFEEIDFFLGKKIIKDVSCNSFLLKEHVEE